MHDPDFDPYLPPRAPVGLSEQEVSGDRNLRRQSLADHLDASPSHDSMDRRYQPFEQRGALIHHLWRQFDDEPFVTEGRR